MLEKSIISQRHVYDEIHEVGGIKNIEISKKCDYIRCARRYYNDYLEKQEIEKKKEDEKKTEKRKLDQKLKVLGEQRKKTLQNKEKQNAIESKMEELKKKKLQCFVNL